MEETNDDLVTVATFNNTAEAGLAREQLANEGVNALVLEGVTGGVMPYLFQGKSASIHLQVRQDDVEKAREILGGEGVLIDENGKPLA